MELFDKKFVHFMWDDELRGKDCFIADNIDGLKTHVNDYSDDHTTRVIDSENTDFPFHEPDGNSWRFCYYDPNYFVKKAFTKGKQIQIKNGKTWYTISDPEWLDDAEYRVKPKEPRRMTNRELARWLAQGKGQKATVNGNAICYHNYGLDDDEEVEDCMIRGWDEAEWREPVIEE